MLEVRVVRMMWGMEMHSTDAEACLLDWFFTDGQPCWHTLEKPVVLRDHQSNSDSLTRVFASLQA